MSVIKKLSKAEASGWMIVAGLAVVIVGLVYFGRQAVAGREVIPGPSKKVYPGMYDLRAEVAKMRASEQGAASNAGSR